MKVDFGPVEGAFAGALVEGQAALAQGVTQTTLGAIPQPLVPERRAATAALAADAREPTGATREGSPGAPRTAAGWRDALA